MVRPQASDWIIHHPDHGDVRVTAAMGRALAAMIAHPEGVIFDRRHPVYVQRLQIVGVELDTALEFGGNRIRVRWFLPPGHGWVIISQPEGR